MTKRSIVRPTRSLTAAALMVALLVPLQAGSAEAAAAPKGWGALGIRLKTKTVATQSGEGVLAIAMCPAGTKVIGGGAYFHSEDPAAAAYIPMSSYLAASVPLASKRGWVASGRHASGFEGVRFTVKALCAERIDYTIATETAVLSEYRTAGGYVECGVGQTVLGGGAYFHDGDGAATAEIAEHSTITSSSVTHDRLAWYVHGVLGGESDSTYMKSVAMCTTTPLKSHVFLQEVVGRSPGGIAAAGLTCRDGQKLLTGGSFWSNDAGGPTPDEATDAVVSASLPVRVDRWSAAGMNHSLEAGDFVVRAMCLPK